MAKSQIQNITVGDAGRGWSSGSADVDGLPVSWETYRKDESAIRVMIARNGRWMPPGMMGAVRSAIEPTARGVMQ